MKKTKIEIDANEAAALYRGLAAYERELKADKEESPAVIAMTLASIARVQDKVALAYEKTRPYKGAKA